MPTSTTTPTWSDVAIAADDGHTLSGRWFAPVDEPRGVAVIVPAMATPSSFYAPFASWLRDRGFAVLTFDFRGYGGSLEGHLRDVDADLVRWAHDARDALAYAHSRAGGLPVTWIGHSLGGQILPFADHTLIDRVIRVASGVGYWRLNAPRARRLAPLLWRVVAPAAIAATGYYPGSRLRILGDLPPRVMRQWMRWCLHPDYLLGELPHLRTAFAAVTAPTMSLSFTDDELMTVESIDALDRLHPAADTARLRFTPQQLGATRVGHFGFFRHHQVDLWDELALPYVAGA